jgi:pilus assembly protein CpaC
VTGDELTLGDIVIAFHNRRAGTARSARRPRLLLTIALALAALLPAAAAPGRAETQEIQVGAGNRSATIRLIGGKSETIRTDRTFVDIIVSDPEIADVVPLTDRSVSILGKKIGTTRVSIYGEGKSIVGVFDVEVTYDTSVLATELRQRFPGARFRVTSINGRIMLSGSAPDAQTVDRAVTIAKQFGAEVINSVKVLQPQQVMLEVRFVEASRKAGRELGINWDVVSSRFAMTLGVAGQLAGFSPFSGAGLVSGNTPFGVAVGRILSNGVTADVMIRALEEKGLVRRLAEPNLIALSGDTASFLAGGEFPIPIAQQNNTITIEWKKFGVGLAFTPTVLDNGIINLKIEPEVSEIDSNNAILIGNLRIPSLTVRRANTTVELRDGQSFAIAGLLQSMTTTDRSQFPWLADVPVLGALLSSTSYQKKETDLAIIITPHLVQPARPGDVLRTPADNMTVGNDADVFLEGRAELTANQLRQRVAPMIPVKPVGHILDLPKGVL